MFPNIISQFETFATFSFSSYFLIFARTLGVVVMLPLGDSMMLLPRGLFTLCIAFWLASNCAVPMSQPFVNDFGSQLLMFALLEVMVGVCMALPMKLVVEAAEMCGELIDIARGQMVAAIQDPLHSQSGSDLAVLGRLLMSVTILLNGGLEGVASGLLNSFRKLPLALNSGGGNPVASLTPDLLASAICNLAAVSAQFLLLASVWVIPIVVVDLIAAMASRFLAGPTFLTMAIGVKTLLTFCLLLILIFSGGSGMTDAIQRAVVLRVPSAVQVDDG